MTTESRPSLPADQREFVDYWARLRSSAADLRKASSALDHCIQLAGLHVGLTFMDEVLAPVYMPALAHLEPVSTYRDKPDITFLVCDAAINHAAPPKLPFAPAEYHRYGWRASFDGTELSIMHTPTAGMLFAYNRRQNMGILWTEDAASLSIYERAAPMQTLFHWALREHGWHVIHAAALGRADGGVLLVGNTGAGKSTTALAALQSADLRYLSDDKCLARLTPVPTAFSLFNSAKLKDDMLDRLPLFRPLVAGWDEGYKIGKSLAFLHPQFQNQMIRSFPIRAVVIPQIAHLNAPRISRARAADAFRALGPSTVIWLPGAEAASYHFLAQLVRVLPCYQLELARDPADNLPAISEIIDAEGN